MEFKLRGVSPYKKRRNYSIWLSYQEKKKGPPLFQQGALHLKFIWVATKKCSSMSWEKLKFSFWQMSWTLVALAVNQRESNFNWTSLTLYSSGLPDKGSFYIFLHILPPNNCLLMPFLKLSCDLEHPHLNFFHLTARDWHITFTIAATNCGKSCHNDDAASATAATPAAGYTGKHWSNSHSVIATAAAACSRSTASCGLVNSYYQPTALSADAATGIRYLPRCRCDLFSCHFFFLVIVSKCHPHAFTSTEKEGLECPPNPSSRLRTFWSRPKPK